MSCSARVTCLTAALMTSAMAMFAPMAHAQAAPTCGSITDPTVTYQVPDIPRPPLRTPIVDPTFGCTITRWTDPSMAPTHSLRHEYSRLVAFNADNTKAAVIAYNGGNLFVLDLASGKLQSVPRGSLDPSVTWHPTDPDRLILYAGNEIRTFRVSTGATTTVMKFPQYEYITTREEGSFSDDWRYAAFLGYKPGANWAKADFVVADLQGGTVVGLMADQTNLPDMIGISPSGQYVVATFLDFTKAFDINMNFLRNLHPGQTHEDFAIDHNGDEVLVYYSWDSAATADWGGKSMVGMVRLKDGLKTALIDTKWQWGGHISGIASRTRPGWILLEDYRGVGAAQTSPFQRELFWISTATKEVRRIAHHHSDQGSDANGKDYFAEPHAVPSWDGTMVAFASVWGSPFQEYDFYSVTGDWFHTGATAPTPTPAPSTTALDTSAPSVPSGVAAKGISSSRIDVSWAASTDNVGVAGYKVYRDGSLLATGVTGTSYSDTNLAVGTTHSYSVAAFDASGNVSAQSAAVSATTPDTTAPSMPSGLAATASSDTAISVSWSASTDNVGVKGYRVYRNGSLVATVTATSFSDSGLTASTSYSYAVESYDAAGNVSTRTGSVSATTQAAPAPVAPASTTTSPTLGSVTFDSSAYGHSRGGRNCSIATIVGSGNNRALAVGVSYYNYDGSTSVQSVSYPGTTMTRVKRSTVSKVTVELWVGVNPPSGANSVAVVTSVPTTTVCGAASFAGVNQAQPLSNTIIATGSGSTASMSVSSAPGSMALGLFTCDSCSVFSFTNSKLWSDGSMGFGTGAGYAANGAASVPYKWTLYSAPWTALGTSLNAAP